MSSRERPMTLRTAVAAALLAFLAAVPLIANAIGEPGRFKQLELAVTFDPQWTYADYDRANTGRSRPVVNAQGVAQGTCIHCGVENKCLIPGF